jgi:hypothetical protein
MLTVSLPLVIASFFTINIKQFPHMPGGDQPSIPLSFVFKYMFGIGFAISIPFIAIALSFDAISDFFRAQRRRFRDRKDKPRLRHDSPNRTIIGDEKLDIEYAVDMRALEQALSAGRSTIRADGRPSIETYLNRRYVGHGATTLSPVPSRSTTRSGQKGNVLVTNGNGMSTVNGRLSVEMTSPVRMSTGFRMRGSGDVERG